MKKKSILLLEALKTLLAGGIIGTQEEIQAALAKQGFQVNQSKISRLLHKVGAVKIKNQSGQLVYQLPKEPSPVAGANLANLVSDMDRNETMIIIHTSPGSASLVARTLDHNQQKLNLLGTVAGDDTIIAIPKSTRQTAQIMEKIKKFLINSL